MAQIPETEKQNESQFMTLFWRLIKDTYMPEQNQEYWDDLAERMGQINGVCESELDLKLLMAYMEYLEAELKRKQEDQEGGRHGRRQTD